MEEQIDPTTEFLRFFASERTVQIEILRKSVNSAELGDFSTGSGVQDHLLRYADMAYVHFESFLPFMEGELKALVAEIWALLGAMFDLKRCSSAGGILWGVLDDSRIIESQLDGLWDLLRRLAKNALVELASK
jgi:hypothetical protein